MAPGEVGPRADVGDTCEPGWVHGTVCFPPALGGSVGLELDGKGMEMWFPV